ncbi:LPXTG cell wall anchor domain-containing protein [Lactococcus allomyrinae]|uniref:LPXTG cell wall anchor domain-containing protein n=1 Tax=Lactococcus allomyrinae TaxID=2419773 RepID=A0A387BAK7_9LACT|nr:LPXTG cell wall anchor domain-containing protein [Lactococcus allomyrinae]AYG00895.1 LPXTG cell wall anchor domain-containing protein [Lactococcus allomyrinae]
MMSEKEQNQQEIINQVKNHAAAKVGSGLLLSATVLGAGAVVQNIAPMALRPIVASADMISSQLYAGQQVGNSSNLVSDTLSSDLTDGSQWSYSTTSGTVGQKETTAPAVQQASKSNTNTNAQSHASAQGMAHSNQNSALHGTAQEQTVATSADKGEDSSVSTDSTMNVGNMAEDSTESETVKEQAPATDSELSSVSTNTVSAVTLPSAYSGTQRGIGIGGGGANATLKSTDAGLASWNSTWSDTYDGYAMSGNSAVTTSDSNVTSDNFQSVLMQANISVDRVAYTNYIASPIMVNGVQYAGYLTTATGTVGDDFVIVVKATDGFTNYNLGANFAFINLSLTASSQALPSVATTSDNTTPEQLSATSNVSSVDDYSVSNPDGFINEASAENASSQTENTQSETNLNQSTEASETNPAEKTPTPRLSGDKLVMTGEQGEQQAVAQYHFPLDMSRPFKFGAHLNGLGTTPSSRSNYLGVTFTPTQSLTEQTSRALGIEGLPYSIFAGWSSDEYHHVLEVLTTDSKGTLLETGQSDVGINPKVELPVSVDGVSAMTVGWNPMMQFNDDIITGSLTVTVGGKTVTHANLKVPAQTYFGFVGAISGQHQSLSFDFSQSSFIASKKAAPILVHYLDQATGFSLAEPTIINGKLGQVFYIGAETNTHETNHYTTPKIAGYHEVSHREEIRKVTSDIAQNEVNIFYEGNPRQQETTYQLPNGEVYQATHHSFTGLDFPEVVIPQLDGYTSKVDGVFSTVIKSEHTDKNQAHTVTYDLIPQKASFDFSYDSTVADELPQLATVVQDGTSQAMIQMPTVSIPTGYFVSSVTTPEGEVFTGNTALKTALTAHPSFVSGDNNFVITLSASYQEAHLTINHPDGSQTYQFATGNTGKVFVFSDLEPKVTDNNGNTYHAVLTSADGTEISLTGTNISDRFDSTMNFGIVDQAIQQYKIDYVKDETTTVPIENMKNSQQAVSTVMPLSVTTEDSVSNIPTVSKTNIPNNYSGTQRGVGVGGGGANNSLTSVNAGLASWNSIWSDTYDGHKITGNSAVTTSDGNVTANNFQAVVQEANISVDGTPYTNYVASPITVNGVQYAGYLTNSDGTTAVDFMIVVKNTDGFEDYNLGADFAYINPSVTNTAPNNNSDNSTPTDSSEITTPPTSPNSTSSEPNQTPTTLPDGSDGATPTTPETPSSPVDIPPTDTTPSPDDDKSTTIPSENPNSTDTTPSIPKVVVPQVNTTVPPTGMIVPTVKVPKTKLQAEHAETTTKVPTKIIPTSNEGANQLPQTGDKSGNLVGVGGLLTASALLLAARRKKEEKDKKEKSEAQQHDGE